MAAIITVPPTPCFLLRWSSRVTPNRPAAEFAPACTRPPGRSSSSEVLPIWLVQQEPQEMTQNEAEEARAKPEYGEWHRMEESWHRRILIGASDG